MLLWFLIRTYREIRVRLLVLSDLIRFHFSGTIQYNDLLGYSSESDIAEIEKIQNSIAPDSGCNLQFTSGTTGHPKAALISHFSIVNNGHDTAIRIGLHKQPYTVCSMMPFFHVAGILSITNTMVYGTTLVLPSPHFHAESSLKTIVKYKCEGVYATPNS